MNKTSTSIWRMGQSKSLILTMILTTILSVLILFCCVLPPLSTLLTGMSGYAALLRTFTFIMPLFFSKVWLYLADLALLAWTGWLLWRSGLAIGRGFRVLFWIEIVILGLGAFFSYLTLPLLRLIGG